LHRLKLEKRNRLYRHRWWWWGGRRRMLHGSLPSNTQNISDFLVFQDYQILNGYKIEISLYTILQLTSGITGLTHCTGGLAEFETGMAVCC